jgi:ATP-dependent Clp protease ATP-binding subunit ClpA
MTDDEVLRSLVARAARIVEDAPDDLREAAFGRVLDLLLSRSGLGARAGPTAGRGWNFTEAVREVLSAARRKALRTGHAMVDPRHFVLALLEATPPPLDRLCTSLGLDPAALGQRLANAPFLRRPGGVTALPATTSPDDLPWSGGAKRALEEALRAAGTLGSRELGPGELLFGALTADEPLRSWLRREGLTPERVMRELTGPAP